MSRHLSKIHVINYNFTGSRLYFLQQQFHQRRFTRAAASHNEHKLSISDGDADIPQSLIASLISFTYI